MTEPTPNPTASAIGYTGGLTCLLAVTDLEHAITWYTEKLGFTFLYRVDEIGIGELLTANPRATIVLRRTGDVTRSGGPAHAFGVEDVDAARTMIEGMGVHFEGETTHIPGHVKYATFRDPDGNALRLYQARNI